MIGVFRNFFDEEPMFIPLSSAAGGIDAALNAILCSLVQTCKHLQLAPSVYVRDVMEWVSTHPARLVLELTPREWKRLRQE